MNLARPGLPSRSTVQLNQPQVESEILRLSDALEAATEEYGARAETAAEADVNWKQAEAKAMLKSEQGSEGKRKAEAIVIHAELHRAAHISDARKDATAELCRTLRAQLDSLRTIASNIRASGG